MLRSVAVTSRQGKLSVRLSVCLSVRTTSKIISRLISSGSSRSTDTNIMSRPFTPSSPKWPIMCRALLYSNSTHSLTQSLHSEGSYSTLQTDRRTDGWTTCHGNTALFVASRDINDKQYIRYGQTVDDMLICFKLASLSFVVTFVGN